MAEFIERQREVKETWREFVLPNPTNWAEIGKATSVAAQHFQAVWKRTACDDEIILKATEDEIVVTFKYPDQPVIT